MDAGRFDALSKSLATRRSRRSLGAGGLAAGLLAALGVEHAAAATKTCSLTILATTATGKQKNTKYDGTLTLTIGDNGAIDQGSFTTNDGKRFPLVGQAVGRALNVRVSLSATEVLALNGTADIDLQLCRGVVSGLFGGPGDGDLGTWRTVAGTSIGAGTNAGGNGGSTGNGGGPSNGSAGSTGGSTGGASGSGNGSSGGSGTSGGGNGGASGSGKGGNATGGNASGGGGGSSCASGVVCGGVCCQAAPGLTPDTMVCNAGACECTYSCAAAGCAGNAQGSIVNTCGSDPQPHCHSECNAPADNGCGAMTCPAGQTLDVASCTCVAAGGGGGGCPAGQTDCSGGGGAPLCLDLAGDTNNCGACGSACPAGQECHGGACGDPCAAAGQANCAGNCVDLTSDNANCGDCNAVCPAGQTCTNSACA